MLTANKESRLRRRATLMTSAGGLCVLMLLVSIHLPAQTQSTKNPGVPEGWLLAGSNPRNYESGLARSAGKLPRFPKCLLESQTVSDGRVWHPHAGI
jgi:hypothetical protein